MPRIQIDLRRHNSSLDLIIIILKYTEIRPYLSDEDLSEKNVKIEIQYTMMIYPFMVKTETPDCNSCSSNVNYQINVAYFLRMVKGK